MLMKGHIKVCMAITFPHQQTCYNLLVIFFINQYVRVHNFCMIVCVVDFWKFIMFCFELLNRVSKLTTLDKSDSSKYLCQICIHVGCPLIFSLYINARTGI